MKGWIGIRNRKLGGRDERVIKIQKLQRGREGSKQKEVGVIMNEAQQVDFRKCDYGIYIKECAI